MKHVSHRITPLLLFLSLLTALFSLAARQGANINYSIFTLQLVSNHYLIIYGLTPIVLLSLLSLISAPSPIVLMRRRTFFRYFLHIGLKIFTLTFLLASIVVCIILMVGIGLEAKNTFASFSENKEIITIFEERFSSPLNAIVACIGFMIMGYSFLGISLLTLSHFTSKKIGTAMALLTYISMPLSIKVPFFQTTSLLTMDRPIILHHNFGSGLTVGWMVLLMITLTISQLVFIKYFWFKQGKSPQVLPFKGIFLYHARALWKKQTILTLLAIPSLLALWRALKTGEESLIHYFIGFLYGYPIGEFHMLTFLEQLIYLGTPLYLFGVFFQGWCQRPPFTILVRVKKKSSFAHALLGNAIILAMIYIGITFIIFYFIGTLFHSPSYEQRTFLKIQFLDVLFIFLLKGLEFAAVILLFLTLIMYMKRVTTAFFTTLGLFSINFVNVEVLQYNLFGISYTARLQTLYQETGFRCSEFLLVPVIYGGCLFFLFQGAYKRYLKGDH